MTLTDRSDEPGSTEIGEQEEQERVNEERRNCVAMVGLSQNLILAKTHADNLGRVRNLNLWGQDISDVSGTPAERQ